MRLKLIKIGNSHGVIIPSKIIKKFHLVEGQTIYIDFVETKTSNDNDLDNLSEKTFQENAMGEGWKTLHGGYPDFIVWNDKKEFFCVEVKSKLNQLSKHQKFVKSFLQSRGIPVIVSKDGKWVNPHKYIIENKDLSLKDPHLS